MSDATIALVDALAKLVVLHELESIEACGVKITKRVHRVVPVPLERPTEARGPIQADETNEEQVEDEILFHSSFERRLTPEDLAHMADKQAGREPDA